MTSLTQMEKLYKTRLYLRISDLTDESTAIIRQERGGLAKAEEIGSGEVIVLKDEDKSGWKEGVHRPGWEQTLEDLRTGRADCLIVYKVDRATRQGIAAVAEIIKIVDATGCRFISIADGIDSTRKYWEMQLVFAGQQAKDESSNTSTRVSDYRAYCRDVGRWVGKRPVGNRVTPVRTLEPHPVEGPMLREVVDRLLAGDSGNSVVRWLNHAHYDAPRWASRKERIAELERKGDSLKAASLRQKPVKSVNAWNWMTLLKIITSPTIAGLMPHNGKVYRHSETGRPVRVGSGIVKLHEYRRLLSMFGPEGSRRRKVAPGKPWADSGRTEIQWTEPKLDAARLLADFLYCGECGTRMTYDLFKAKNGESRPRYKCRLGFTGGGVVRQCSGAVVTGHLVDSFVEQAVFTRLGALDRESVTVLAIADRWLEAKFPQRSAERAELHARIAEEEAYLDRLEDEKLNGLFKDKRGLERFQRRYDECGARLERLETALAAVPQDNALDVGFLEVMEEMEKAWNLSPLPEKRQMLSLMVNRVWVRKAVHVTVADGPAGDVLLWVLAQFDQRVEDLDMGADDWGYANRPIRGSTTTSNHASATAVDANATRHPLGKVGTFNGGQVAEIHRILSEVDNAVRWGGDYTGRRDEMHFEINASYARVAVVAARLNGGTPAPPTSGSGGHATVKRGSTGADVALVQRYLGLKADGIFGADTEAAVRRYQSAQGLTADGVVGPATWGRIVSGLGGSAPGGAGGGPSPAEPRATLKRGSQGVAITALQRRLNAWYPAYSHLTADGVFGAGTESVVREFQRRAGLTADGIAGPRTLAALNL